MYIISFIHLVARVSFVYSLYLVEVYLFIYLFIYLIKHFIHLTIEYNIYLVLAEIEEKISNKSIMT